MDEMNRVLAAIHDTDLAATGLAEADAGALFVLGMAASLLAAAAWLHIATTMGLPVSTTHSIVGAVAGFGVVAAGWSVVNWGKMGQIAASWVISPVLGGAVAAMFLVNFLGGFTVIHALLKHHNTYCSYADTIIDLSDHPVPERAPDVPAALRPLT